MNRQESFQVQLTPEILAMSADVTCNRCMNDTFKPVMNFKLVPGVAVGSPKDILYPVQVFCCDRCNEFLDMENLKKNNGKEEERRIITG